MRRCASCISWRLGPAKEEVVESLNEKTLRRGIMAQLVSSWTMPHKKFAIFLHSLRSSLESNLPLSKLNPRAAASGKEAMSSSERRVDTRVNVRVPLRFRALNNPGSTEQSAQSENISQRGLYFMTNVPLKIGTPVEVSLRMP